MWEKARPEYEFDIFVPEKDSGGAATYDAADWCGERVADEACRYHVSVSQ